MGELVAGGRQLVAAMNARVHEMTPAARAAWYAEHPASMYQLPEVPVPEELAERVRVVVSDTFCTFIAVLAAHFAEGTGEMVAADVPEWAAFRKLAAEKLAAELTAWSTS